MDARPVAGPGRRCDPHRRAEGMAGPDGAAAGPGAATADPTQRDAYGCPARRLGQARLARLACFLEEDSMTSGDVDFKDAVGKMHTEVFGRVTNTPWYADAVYERFSDAEYQRRFVA